MSGSPGAFDFVVGPQAEEGVRVLNTRRRSQIDRSSAGAIADWVFSGVQRWQLPGTLVGRGLFRYSREQSVHEYLRPVVRRTIHFAIATRPNVIGQEKMPLPNPQSIEVSETRAEPQWGAAVKAYVVFVWNPAEDLLRMVQLVFGDQQSVDGQTPPIHLIDARRNITDPRLYLRGYEFTLPSMRFLIRRAGE
jgi:hypothetical protein